MRYPVYPQTNKITLCTSIHFQLPTQKIFIIIFPDLKKDDLVILVNDEQFVKSALINSNFLWDDKMRLMLGKTFPILETRDGRTVALPSPDGSQDGKWYFPISVLTMVGLDKAFEWSCEHGQENLTEFLTTHSKTLEIQVFRMCTFKKTEAGKKIIKQIRYDCNTCNMIGDEGVCHACAKVCHADHEVTYANHDSSFFCKCGSNQDGSCIALALPQNGSLCTFIVSKKKGFIKQHMYHCNTCNLIESPEDDLGACSRCVKICHKNHDVSYIGFKDFFCDCGCEEHVPCLALDDKSKFMYDEVLYKCQKDDILEPIINWAQERFNNLYGQSSHFPNSVPNTLQLLTRSK